MGGGEDRMKCPRDGATLSTVTVLGVELDKCHKCDGIWCDRGELERLRDAAPEDVEEILEKEYGDPDHEEGAVEGYMRCPRCVDARLRDQAYTFTTRPLRIDRCERCYGFWIDDTELNAIIGHKQELREDERKYLSILWQLAEKVEGRGKGPGRPPKRS